MSDWIKFERDGRLYFERPKYFSGLNWFDNAKENYADKWRSAAKQVIENQLAAFETIYELPDKKEEPKLKVSYKGVTGELLKLERNQPKGKLIVDGVDYASAVEHLTYTLEIYDGHKHVFDNVDLHDVQFVGATVTLA